MKKKIVIGLSGGVDSAVSAYLLLQEGYDVIGVTMHHFDIDEEMKKDGVIAPEVDARKVADALNIPFYVVDFREEFRCGVMDYFVKEYVNGRTPNPCVVCNRKVKWQALLEKAAEFGADEIATGHYARIDRLDNGRLAIRNSVTAAKDQTYALYNLTQEQLAHTKMPVGAYSKEQIREIAVRAGIPVAGKSDSQEICFIPDNDYAGFIEKKMGKEAVGPGNFVWKDGTVLGPHKGIIHYTIGQRKGLDIAMGHPVFVTEIRPQTGEVILGEAEDVFTQVLEAEQINFMGMEKLNGKEKLLGKIRYGHKGTACEVEQIGKDRIRATFDTPVRAVTPGQAIVLYSGEHVMLGGTICQKN